VSHKLFTAALKSQKENSVVKILISSSL